MDRVIFNIKYSILNKSNFPQPNEPRNIQS